MYYIEGTIDAIELTVGNEKTLQFTLLPSTEFLQTMKDGAKKALFIDKSGKLAQFAETMKNAHEKDVREFNSQNADCSLKCLLLEAKNNRNTVRVFAKSKATLTTPSSITIL